jgi:hypothetical protein
LSRRLSDGNSRGSKFALSRVAQGLQRWSFLWSSPIGWLPGKRLDHLSPNAPRQRPIVDGFEQILNARTGPPITSCMGSVSRHHNVLCQSASSVTDLTVTDLTCGAEQVPIGGGSFTKSGWGNSHKGNAAYGASRYRTGTAFA